MEIFHYNIETKMFKKILIANRGEIACRIAKTCKKMGISTLGIYSDSDSRAKHLEFMDEIVNIGASESIHSYLNINKIVGIAKQYKVDAVHPGYGFLSENSKFASKLINEGITFIGPPVRAIKVMGDKIESKKIARKAGVNVIPGGEKAILNVSAAKKEAKKIGYPVMVKASAGGGGKGMRIAKNEKELESGFKSARNEAKQTFDDDRVFIEKYIINPRHIEIQILADNKGKMVYLGERECSVQRRHQKIIEECPSPLVDESMRKKMGEQALLLAKAVNYYSAGTVEFVASADKSFYFLEMNTRLQVEHPVTELVVGLDLVELMISIAANKNLEISQSDINLNGWAMEARIYAEDPLHNFMPSTGRIKSFLSPEVMQDDANTIRLDSGVGIGNEIGIYYDPMMAKLIAYSPTREETRINLSKALDFFVLNGVTNNIAFLNNVLNNSAFVSGKMNTGFIDQEYKNGFLGTEVVDNTKFVVAITALSLKAIDCRRQVYIGKRNSGEFIVTIDDNEFVFEYDFLDSTSPNEYKLKIKYKKRQSILVLTQIFNSSLVKILFEDKYYFLQCQKRIGGYNIKHGGYEGVTLVSSKYARDLKRDIPKKIITGSQKTLLSPMPGRVVKVFVEKGQKVNIGDDLIILDAMKMENVIKSEKDTEIAIVHVKEDETVFVDQELIDFL